MLSFPKTIGAVCRSIGRAKWCRECLYRMDMGKQADSRIGSRTDKLYATCRRTIRLR